MKEFCLFKKIIKRLSEANSGIRHYSRVNCHLFRLPAAGYWQVDMDYLKGMMPQVNDI